MSETGSRASLSVLDQRLEAHFAALRSQRDESAGSEFPLFALEHGLSDLELSLLSTTVRDAVGRRHLPMAASLPFVVYAAEVGYDYSGDEYWPMFSQRTPGWSYEDREFIRQGFQRFATRFGGAVPAGPWAAHFSIICWPITHAVLPTDLQQHLVRLLFEYRTGLTGDLLADPASLGRRLAARTGNYSSRFRYFAQNAALLGQVAAALLSPENESSPYLVDSTLQRIVGSLSKHHQARRWLRDAKSTANHVRTSGFRRSPSTNGAASGNQPVERLPRGADPGVFVQLSEHGWEVYLQLPDLSLLAEQLPDLYEQLRGTRVRLAGRRSLLARGRLLAGDQRVRLDEWPASQVPLLQFEGDSLASANRLLADHCVLSPGPAWLFRVREPGLATEVRGKVVRPGNLYVLLIRADLPTDGRPPWVVTAPCATAGVSAYIVQVPAVLDERATAALASLGIGVLADVSVRPAGIIPSDWDGQGSLTSLAGDDVVIAIESGRTVTQCIVRLDGKTEMLEWPLGENELFVGLSGLEVGSHAVDVALLSAGVDGAVAEGSLSVIVRTTPVRPSGGSPREGLVLLADPPAPVMEDVWEGRAPIELLGPTGAEVTVAATLEGIRGGVLATERVKLRTPVDAATWSKTVASQLRSSRAFQHCYDESEVLTLTASSPDLGSVELRCEREFSPFRWVLRRDRTGPYAHLVDNTDGSAAEVTRYAFGSPATAESLDSAVSEVLRWPAGGLLRARVDTFQALVIMPPHVHGDLSDLRDALPAPDIPSRPRSADEMLSLMELCAQWATASLPGDPFAEFERRRVLQVLTAGVVSVAAGSRWSQLERRGTRYDNFVFQELREAVGAEDYQRGIADAISRRLSAWDTLDPEKRAQEFGSVLAAFSHRTHVRDDAGRVGEFLLRAASEPSSLEGWPADEKASLVDRVITSPVLIRAARFVVLGIHLDSDDDDPASIYRGWSWA
ncbi:MAG: hypothetical protein M0Z95_19705 [Actinomycetota bacterium]|nr:hypothetical protein [Actinomycetota bacterium]